MQLLVISRSKDAESSCYFAKSGIWTQSRKKCRKVRWLSRPVQWLSRNPGTLHEDKSFLKQYLCFPEFTFFFFHQVKALPDKTCASYSAFVRFNSESVCDSLCLLFLFIISMIFFTCFLLCVCVLALRRFI